jgi:hypothetical protein
VLEITLAQKVSVEHAALPCMLWAVRLSFADLGLNFPLASSTWFYYVMN